MAGVVSTPAIAAQSVCEQAGVEAERAFNLPAGLLLAIGRVESGRWDPVLGRTVPWPWSVNLAGNGQHLPTKADAVSAVRQALAAGVRSIDTGCFQINLQHHPTAFADPEQAFDPTANARYAARFLNELREKFGNWEIAVQHYHSANPERGIPYGRMVIARWTGSPPPPAAGPAVPVVANGMRIWTPSPLGTAPALISIESKPTTPVKLPRVTVLAR
ncbi:MAG: transglycosylase SLT domain-containing protein [Acetobacteraceae bacterium]